MVRVEDLNITFFHLPKNAGTSIANWLTDNLGGEEYMDDLRHVYPDHVKPMFGDFGWSFCCVRNSWDRTVSWYNFFLKQGKINISFVEYMDRIINNDITEKYIIAPAQQKKYGDSVDFVIRYETLLEDFKVVQKKTNCYVSLGHDNQVSRSKYQDYFTKQDHIDWIKERYKKDIDEYGFTFGG
jgi:hypothetical protein